MGAQKRPPRQVWLVKPDGDESFKRVLRTRREAVAYVEACTAGAEWAGPYVLAERVRER